LAALQAFNREIELLEIIGAAMESLVDEFPFEWEGVAAGRVWDQVDRVYDALVTWPLASLEPARAARPAGGARALATVPLAEIHRDLLDRVGQIVKTRGRPEARVAEARRTADLLTLTDGHEAEIVGRLREGDRVRRAYERFEAIDKHLFPLELLSGLAQKDIIETVRISPRDAEKGFSRRGFSDKVAGDPLYPFRRFF